MVDLSAEDGGDPIAEETVQSTLEADPRWAPGDRVRRGHGARMHRRFDGSETKMMGPRVADQTDGAVPAPRRSRPTLRHGWLVAFALLAADGFATDAEAQDSEDPPQQEPIPVYRQGRVVDGMTVAQARAAGLWIFDVGEAWLPPLFRSDAEGNQAHGYAQTFSALAREAFPDDPQGYRARQDRYLEVYGIPPTLAVLRARFEAAQLKGCRRSIDFETLRAFRGTVISETARLPIIGPNAHALEPVVEHLMLRQDAYSEWELDHTFLGIETRRRLGMHGAAALWPRAIRAVQQRMLCDGLYAGHVSGVVDSRTRNALGLFERRHRIYARGTLHGETLAALRTDPLELERRAVIRVLTERAVLTFGILEDGSAIRNPDGTRRTYVGADGQDHSLPDMVGALESHLVGALGLETSQSTAQFLSELGDLVPNEHQFIAIDPVAVPEYYGRDMDLYAEIDRGDIYYEFPYDENGEAIDFNIERRPTLTLFTRYRDQSIPLVRYGTTIGGWRVQRDRSGADVWRYLESPVGKRVWAQILSAPVWLPPVSEPPEALVTQVRQAADGTLIHELNTNLVGPGYASAYGLVAAYHRRFERRRDGSLALGSDEGIRTHGSADYTSIWQRASHGCHRLHNHLAMRFFGFVLAHRPHRIVGHRPIGYRVRVQTEGFSGEIRIDRGGFIFALRNPIEVDVLPGRIRGTLTQASTEAIPVAPIADSAAPGGTTADGAAEDGAAEDGAAENGAASDDSPGTNQVGEGH